MSELTLNDILDILANNVDLLLPTQAVSVKEYKKGEALEIFYTPEDREPELKWVDITMLKEIETFNFLAKFNHHDNVIKEIEAYYTNIRLMF